MNNRKEQLKQVRAYISGAISQKIYSDSIQDALKEFLAHYPSLSYWRLLVDGSLYATQPDAIEHFRRYSKDKYGWVNYEKREPGSVTAFLAAWQYCLSCLQSQATPIVLTKEFIISLHQKVAQDVVNINSKRDTVRNVGVSFSFTKTLLPRYTKQGIKNLLQTIEASCSTAKILLSTDVLRKTQLTRNAVIKGYSSNGDMDNIFVNANELQSYLAKDEEIAVLTWKEIKKSHITYQAPEEEQAVLETMFEKIVADYNNKITVANDDNCKMIIIGEAIQAFERLHPFTDCNGRTFVNLLLNYLLLQQGFPPATLFEPNVFDAYDDGSGEGLLNIIKNGIVNTLTVYEGKFDLFETTIHEKNELKIQMQAMLTKAKLRNYYFQLEDMQIACVDSQKKEEVKKTISSLLQDSTFYFYSQYEMLDVDKYFSKLIKSILKKLDDKQINYQFELLNNKSLIELLGKKDMDYHVVHKIANEIFTNLYSCKYKNYTNLVSVLLIYHQTIHPLFDENTLRNALFYTITSHDTEKLELLLNCKAMNIDVRDDGNYTPLLEAVNQGSISAVTAILKHPDCNINFRHPSNKATALFLAVQRNYIEIVKILLDYGANIHFALVREAKALMETALYLNIKDNMQAFILKQLDKNNINEVESTDKISITPLEMANMKEYHEIADMLQFWQKKQELALVCVSGNVLHDSHEIKVSKCTIPY